MCGTYLPPVIQPNTPSVFYGKVTRLARVGTQAGYKRIAN